jgi:formylmethanofuran dehydrogenase subunit E
MKKLISLIGQEFDGTKVIAFAGRSKNSVAQWECLCKCGRTVIKRAGALKNGITGCMFCRKKGGRPKSKVKKKIIPDLICELCGAPAIRTLRACVDDKTYNLLCRGCFVNIC